MSNLKKYQNKKIAVYGMGKSGLSSALRLKKIAQVLCWDDNKKIRSNLNKLGLVNNKFWLNKKKKIDYIVISPGIDINKCKISNYLKKNKNKIITDLDIFFESNKNVPIISVTGTNGKSTTCKIIQKILIKAGYNARVGGNIGKPILSLKKSKKKNIYILEVSSYQLQYSKPFQSNHAVILNISPDHLERHKNMKGYIRTKFRIFKGQKKGSFSYISSNDKHSRLIKKNFRLNKLKSKLVDVSKKDCSSILKKIKNSYFRINCNINNLCFAYKIVKKLKVKDSIIIRALNQFKGLKHRQKVIFSNRKITCIDDSKATSFDASLQSLINYKRIYWIVGGLPKLGDRFYLDDVSKKIIKAYIIGKKAPFFVDQIKKKIPYKISNDLKNAIENIYKDVNESNFSNNNILLSPAAASFDQFSNFEDRGNKFKTLILKKFKKN